MKQQALTCPVCQSPLIQSDKNLRCEQGHSFDQAKQGYWNLLLVQNKRSKDPGDNAEMVQARRAFLDQGYYQPLSDRINQLSCQLLEKESDTQVMDMGCGEGYYSTRLADALEQTSIDAAISALDISKHAVKAASKRNKSIQWLVASGADMPVAAESQDLLTVLFSRLMPEPFAKVVKSGGHLLLVWPADNHLIELREMIYDQIKASSYDPAAQLADFFQLTEQQRLSFPFKLKRAEDIQALLQMTPHSQRMPEAKRAQLAEQQNLALSFDVNIAVFQRL